MKHFAFLLSIGVGLSAIGCGGEPASKPFDVARARIVGGQIDDTDKAAVGLAVNIFGNFSGHCSGTLISPNLVLTARHCVSLTSGGGPAGSVVCGQTNFGLTGGGSIFRATTLTVRPLTDGAGFYKGTGNVTVPQATDICGNDIALITLEGAGVPASEATPIIPRIDSKPDQAEEYSALGYGFSDTAKTEAGYGTRRRVDGKLVVCLGGECSGIGGDQVKPTEWAGEDGTCNGDSGGPALDAQGRVMGVLSRGADPCATSVYGDVSSWKDLLMQTAVTAAQQGGIEPPFWAVTGTSTPPVTDAGTGGSGGSEGGVDPQGQTCSSGSPCPTGYLCVASGAADTGQCMKSCDPAAPACGTGTTCDGKLSVCSPNPAKKVTDSGDSGGCALAGPVRPVPWLVGVLFGVAVAIRRRRASR